MNSPQFIRESLLKHWGNIFLKTEKMRVKYPVINIHLQKNKKHWAQSMWCMNTFIQVLLLATVKLRGWCVPSYTWLGSKLSISSLNPLKPVPLTMVFNQEKTKHCSFLASALQVRVKHEYLQQTLTLHVFVCLCAGWISLMVELTKLNTAASCDSFDLLPVWVPSAAQAGMQETRSWENSSSGKTLTAPQEYHTVRLCMVRCTTTLLKWLHE